MTADMLIVFGVLGGALVLFVTDLVRVDVVAILVVIALTASGVLEARQAFLGFGAEPIIFLAGLFVLSGGLVRTGVVDSVALLLQAGVRRRPGRLASACVATVALVSAFVSNTATVSIFVPVVNRLSKRGGMEPARVLMPMAYASMLGGVCTVIGTSTNVAVSGQLETFELEPYALFETAQVGFPALMIGMVYLLVVAPRLLRSGSATPVVDVVGVRSYLAEVIVDDQSSWVGRTIATLRPRDQGVEVLGLMRGGGEVQVINPDDEFNAGDKVLVKASSEDLLRLTAQAGLKTVADQQEVDDAASELVMVEAMVAPGSRLAGHTLKEARFRQRFGAVALAIFRHGAALQVKVGRVRLHVGDILLVQGTERTIEELAADADTIILDNVSHFRVRRRDRWIALSVFAGFLVLGVTTGELALAALCGAAAMVVTGCLTAEDAYAHADWRLLVLIGGMLSLATAMRDTGAAAWLAHQVVDFVGGWGLSGIVAAFFLLTVVLTQAMSNQAAALVVVPVAVAAAVESGLPVRPLVVAVTIAASCAFLTPLEPVNVLVFGPGRYRFRDFAIVGAPLTLIVLVLTVLLVPVFW